MNKNTNNFESIPQEKFEFVQMDARLHDSKIETKFRSFFADAMLRFRKNKSSVFAAWINVRTVSRACSFASVHLLLKK